MQYINGIVSVATSRGTTELVYRAQHNDHTMGLMEPADTFTLTLRGYQKQALLLGRLFFPLMYI